MNERLSLLVESVEVPPEGPERARRAGSGRLRRRRVVGSLAAAIVVVVLALLVVPDRGGERVTTDPATTAPAGPVIGPPLLDLPAEALNAQPVIPDGWKPVDYGLGRVWVPGNYVVVSAETNVPCADGPSGPVVLVGQAHYACAPPTSVLRVDLGREDTSSATINGLRVKRTPTGVQVVSLSLLLTGSNLAEFDEVVATVGPSPVARVMADGPLVGTKGWRRVNVPVADANTTGTTLPLPPGATSLWVPGDWPVRDISVADWCAAMSGSAPPEVIMGTPHGPVACQPSFLSEVGIPIDLVSLPGHGNVGEPAAQLTFEGRTLMVGAGRNAAVLTISTDNGYQPIAVGIGPDPAVARTILRTLSLG